MLSVCLNFLRAPVIMAELLLARPGDPIDFFVFGLIVMGGA